MTTKSRSSAQQIGLIKAGLIIGSLIASFQGARAVAFKDAAANTAASLPAEAPEPIVIRIYESPGIIPGPAPRIIQPQQQTQRPVTRSQSSN